MIQYLALPTILALALFAGSGCSRETKKNRLLERANRDFTAGNYARAEIEYLKVLQAASLNPEAIRQLGFVYYNQGRLPQSYAHLKKAAELDPENAEIRVKLGSICLSGRELREAQDHALWVLERNRGHEEALLLLADCATTPQERLETLQRLEQLRQKDKDRAGYHVAAGSLYLRQQEFEKAESELKQALAMDPNSSAAHLVLGTLYWARNELAPAGQALKAASDLAPPRSGAKLKYADFKLSTGAAEEARQIAEAIVKTAPDYLPAQIFLLRAALAQKKYEDCDTLAGKILAGDPANYDALLARGKLNLAKGETAKALAAFERLGALYARVPQIHYHFALAHLQNNDRPKAAASLTQAIALEPNFVEAILLLAELNLRKGDASPVVAAMSQLVKQHPRMAQAQLLLAAAHLARKDLDSAAEVYRQLMVLFPQEPQTPFLLGTVFARQNKLADARRAFETALELAPDSLLALEQLLDLDLLEQRYQAASERVQKQMEKQPKTAELWLLQAKIHQARRDSSQAEAALLKAIELNPNLRAPYLLLAQVHVSANQQQRALERLASFVARTNDVAVLMQMGMIHQELKSFSQARDAYEKLLSVNPKFSPALNNLACLYSEHLGQLDQARELAEKSRQLLPNDPYTADTLGWIFYKQGDYPRALALIQESAQKLPSEPEIQFHLGLTHYRMGEEGPARAALEQAVRGTKSYPGKEEADRRLALLALDPQAASPAILKELQAALQEDPGDQIVLSRLAAIYDRDGMFDKAAAACEGALKKNPQNVQLMFRLARLYGIRLGQPRKALELLGEAHKLAPQDPAISHWLGRLASQEEGNYKWAVSLLEDSVRKLPSDPEVLYDLAWAYYCLGRTTDSEETLRRATQTGNSFSRSDEAKRFLAMLTVGKDPASAPQAAAQVRQFLAADPNYIPALMVSALVEKQRTNYHNAKTAYEKVLAIAPQFAPASRDLAILCAELLGDDQRAYPLALTAREAFPNDPELARTLGLLLYRRGDYAKSAQLLKEIARKRNDDAHLQYHLGMALYRLKEKSECQTALQRALALNLQPKLAENAKRTLTELN